MKPIWDGSGPIIVSIPWIILRSADETFFKFESVLMSRFLVTAEITRPTHESASGIDYIRWSTQFLTPRTTHAPFSANFHRYLRQSLFFGSLQNRTQWTFTDRLTDPQQQPSSLFCVVL